MKYTVYGLHLRRKFTFLAHEVRGLQAAVYVLAACSFLSSILALVRDHLFAHVFGAGPQLDIYNAAFRLPDLLLVTLGALVSVYVLIPELARRTDPAQKSYLDTIVVAFSWFAIAMAGIVALNAPAILALLFSPIAQAGHLPELVALTRVILLQPILLGFSNILAAITQSRRRYFLYALSPLFYNLGIIFGIVFFYPLWGLAGLGWGVVLGALLHAGIQLPSVIADGFFTTIPKLREPRVIISTVLVSIPRSLALSMGQVAYLGLLAIASALAPGSISIFAFAYNLQSVPLGIIGASYSVAAFPTLAKALSDGRTKEFVEYMAIAARHILFLSIPASALLIVLRAHVVRVILGSGAFDWTDTRLTAAAFALFAFSLAPQGLSLLLARGYYAAGRTFVPFLVACAGMMLTLGSAFLLLGAFHVEGVMRFVEMIMRVDGVPGSAALALPFSFSIASIAGVLMLCVHFDTRFGGFLERIRDTFWHSMAAGLVGGAVTYAVLYVLGPLDFSSTLASVFVRGFAAGVAGLLGVAVTYATLGNQEYKDTVSTIRARLWRQPLSPIQPITSSEDAA